MTRFALSLLAATTLAGCTSNSGVATTPTFTAARFLPAVAQGGPSPDAAKRPQAAPQTNQRPYATGGRAVDLANRAATVEPSSQTMQGATWVIDDVQPSRIYRVATAPGRVTTILLPAGERFNGAVGGNVEAFLINVSLCRAAAGGLDPAAQRRWHRQPAAGDHRRVLQLRSARQPLRRPQSGRCGAAGGGRAGGSEPAGLAAAGG